MHNRLAFVDALRGIAVLAVVLQHLLEQIILGGTTGAFYGPLHDISGHYFNFGRFGVVLFFFVSGFVIPYSFPKSSAPVKDFAVSRFFRLYPSYWLSILIAVVLAPIIENKIFPIWQISANLTMFQMFVGVPNIRIAYWSLAVELIFYIACVALFVAGFLNRRLTAVCIVVAVSLVGILGPALVHYWLFWRLLELALNLTAMFTGKVARDVLMERRLSPWYLVVCVTLYCAFALNIAFKLYGGDYHENFFHGYSIGFAYVAAALVFLAFALFGEGRPWRALAFVGVISYSIYLMHAYVMSLALYFVGTGAGPAQWLVFVVGVVAASILVSWISYVLVEKPTISFGRRYRSAPPRAAMTEAPLPAAE
jgi:peptidoglycan/LPS O-acetylase OafA/YrhL